MAQPNLIKKFDLKNKELLEMIPASLVKLFKHNDPDVSLSKNYPYEKKLSRKTYEKEKRRLQIELLKLQNWIIKEKKRFVVIFEGRDAAGKGGTIKRFTEHLNPRQAKIIALNKPTSEEAGQWYFQRYVKCMPTQGEMTFFDRSWYNRAGVEKVMGFCDAKQYKTFLQHVPQFETMLSQSGVHLIKFWFSVSREEQFRRILGRAQDPLKQWKLSEMDYLSLGKWNEYTKAKETMFTTTDHPDGPWTIVRSDDKKRARLNAMRFVLDQFQYENKKTKDLFELDPAILGPVASFSRKVLL